MTITDSCLGYMCKHDLKWTIGVEVCVCYDEQLQKDVEDQVFGDKYQRLDFCNI